MLSQFRFRCDGVVCRVLGFATFVVLLFGVGCSSSKNTVTIGPPAKLAFMAQPGSVAAGSSITPAVTVSIEDANGNVVTTATNQVTIAIGTNPSSGTLAGTAQAAAVAGVATFSNLSINNAGTGYTLAASATGLTGATSGAFTVFGPAAKLAFTVQPGNVAAGSSITPAVVVSVEDAQGNVVATATNQITIAIGTNPSSGTLSGTAQANATAGVATFSNLSINKVGTGYTLTASATGLTSAISGAFNVAAGAAAKLAFTAQPSNATGGATISPAIQVTVEDSQGNTVTTATNQVTIAIGTNPSNGTLSGTAQASTVAGVATFSALSIDKAGSGYTLAASATGLAGATSGAFNILVGPATMLAFTAQATTAGAGATITPAVAVSVEDAGGNVVTTATNQVTIAIGQNPATGTLSGTAQVNAVAGVATFSTLSINNAGMGYTLTASATGLTGATSSAFNIFGAASKLAFTVQPSNAAPGSSITPAVQVTIEDSQGSTVTTATNQVTIAIGTNPASGTLGGTAQVNAVSGVATFSNLSINNAGTGYTLTANATGLTGATSNSFNVTAAPACGSGSESMLNGQYAFELKGFDGSGNVVLIGGVLTADGGGNLTAGAVDMNLNAGVQSNLAIASGSKYTIGSDHRGCMAITTTAGTQNYRFALGALSSGVASSGHMIDFDVAGPFTTGVLRKQNSAAFSTAQVSGNYAFGVSSPQDNLGSNFAAMGVLNLSGGSVTGGAVDFNDYNGSTHTSKLDGVSGTTTWPTSPIAISSGGSYTVSGINGRGTLSFTPSTPGASVVNAFTYVVSSTEVLIVSSDARAVNGLFAGTALQQTVSSFTNSSLNGKSVYYTSKPSTISSSVTSQVTIGLVTTTGASATFTFAGYNNNGGNIATPATENASGTFSVAANGRITLTVAGGGGGGQPEFFMVSPNTAFVVSSGDGAESGFAEAQTSTALTGTYAIGNINPQSTGESDNLGVPVFASPNVTGTSDDNSQGTLSPNGAISSTYSVDSNGVVFVPASCTPGTNCNKIGTIISASKFVIFDAKTTNLNPKLTIADQ